jgi:drug/metabolite transporter (DMT)-like permease
MEQKSPFSTHIILLLVTFSWALNVVFMKIGFREIDPWMFSTLRLLTSLPIVLLIARLSPGYVRFEWKDLLKISGIACVGFTGFQFLFPLGLNGVSTPVGGILMATVPVWVLLINLIARISKISAATILGLLLTLSGVLIITVLPSLESGGEVGKTTVSGVVFLVLAELFFAINSVFLKPFMKKYSIPQVTAVAIVISTLLFVAVLNKRIVTFDYASLSISTWGILLFSGIIALFISNIFWNRAIKRTSSLKVSLYANMPPVFVLILGVLIFGERLNGVQSIGAVVRVAGIILAQVKHRKKDTANNV